MPQCSRDGAFEKTWGLWKLKDDYISFPEKGLNLTFNLPTQILYFFFFFTIFAFTQNL